MDAEDEQTVRDVVEEILANADMDSITEKQVRKLAAEKTGLDLSNPPGKELVLSVIKSFLAAQDEAAAAPPPPPPPVEVAATPPESGNEDEEEEVPRHRAKHQKGSALRDNRSERGLPVKQAKQAKRATEMKQNGREVEDNDDFLDDEDEEEEHGKQEKKSKYEKDAQGNIIICELSAKRKVVISQFKGRTLISIREYYEKDGQMLPSSKGISLTQEQFEKLAKSSKDIEAAISNMR